MHTRKANNNSNSNNLQREIDPLKWNPAQVSAWIKSCGEKFGKHAFEFENKRIDGAQLLLMSLEDLRQIATNAKKIICKLLLTKIKELKRDSKISDVNLGTPDTNSNSNSNSGKRRRKIDFKKYPKLKTMRTRKADVLFGYTDKFGYDVISMPCGHAMESNSMFLYIKSKFESNNACIQMNCPMTDCDTIWDWQLCCHIAGMSREEYFKYSTTRNNRSLSDIRECPHCHRLNERKPSLAILRVACVCAKGDWCWVCAQPWRGPGLMICGNKQCSFMKNLNRTLVTCQWSIPWGWEHLKIKVKLPDIRACPHCLAFMTKTGMSKTMKCAKCEYNFCFSCLALGDKTNEPKCKVGTNFSSMSSHYKGLCQVARIQQFQ